MSSQTVAAKYINKGDKVIIYGKRTRAVTVVKAFKFDDHVTLVLSDKRTKPLVLNPDSRLALA